VAGRQNGEQGMAGENRGDDGLLLRFELGVAKMFLQSFAQFFLLGGRRCRILQALINRA